MLQVQLARCTKGLAKRVDFTEVEYSLHRMEHRIAKLAVKWSYLDCLV